MIFSKKFSKNPQKITIILYTCHKIQDHNTRVNLTLVQGLHKSIQEVNSETEIQAHAHEVT